MAQDPAALEHCDFQSLALLANSTVGFAYHKRLMHHVNDKAACMVFNKLLACWLVTCMSHPVCMMHMHQVVENDLLDW